MKISTMLLIMETLLIAGGVFKHASERAAGGTGRCVFFLFSLFVLDRFTFCPTDETSISAACAAAAVWLGANAFSGGEKPLNAVLMFPAALLAGAASAPLAASGSEAAAYAAGLISVPAAIILGERVGIAAAALAPVTACAVCYLLKLPGCAVLSFELTEFCLSSQLAGLFAVFAAAPVKNAILRTFARGRSVVRTRI